MKNFRDILAGITPPVCNHACRRRSECLRQGPFAPRALPRFVATTGPSVGLSPSPRFAFRFAQLPCSAVFLRGVRSPSLLPLTPPGVRPRRALSVAPAAFAKF